MVTDDKYNRQVALNLCQDLMDRARRMAESIKFGPEEGPLIDDTCERLRKILAELTTATRP